MRIIRGAAVLVAASFLAACGGGSGGGGRVETVGPPPPKPTNTNIADLKADGTFTGPAATSESVFNTVSGTTVSSSGAPATLSVTYDASAKSYTVALPGRTQVFSESDLVAAPALGESRYQKGWAEGNDRLTLVTTPFSGGDGNRYVGLGFWQRSSNSTDRQADQFATFVYGFDTPAAAMPRTGRANYAIDVFGLSTVPGYEPSVFQGLGTFDVDFMAGVFSTQTYLTETGLLTGDGVVGGGIELIGAGHLTSGDATFSGNVTVGSRNANLSGTLSGKFYGPGADEIGASFSATNADGATATGSFTGQRGNGPAVNLTLVNLVTPQLFYAQGTALFIGDTGYPEANLWTYTMTGQFEDRTSGNFSFGPGLSNMAGGDFTTASIVESSDPNFTVYEKTFPDTVFGDRDVRLELYKVGQANSELALTYTTLGRWQSAERHGENIEHQYHHFVYGLETPERLLAARTGSARYEGVVYGAGGNRTTAAHYDVRGTSRFDVDFTNQSYSGALALNGRNADGAVDFGSYDFAGRLSAWTKESTATITHGANPVGEIFTRFFGPTGEEIGGSFGLTVPEAIHPGGTVIAGATVARRR